jgi:hypothetical protein
MMRIYTTEDSRFQAARWVGANIPEGEGVLTERGGFPTYWMVPEDRYRREIGQASFFIATEGNYPYGEKVRFLRNKLHGLNWIVLTEENRMRQYIEVPDRYPVAQRFYSQLASGDLGFERVASLKVCPGILGLEFSEEGAEPTITAFDHPRVSIYRRAGTDFDNLMASWETEVRADPALPDHHILAGVKAYHGKEWDTAIEQFRRAVALRPSLTLGRLLLREAYLRQGRKAEAKRQLGHLTSATGIPMRAIVGLIKVGLKAEGVVYLEKYIHWVKSRGRDDPQLREFTCPWHPGRDMTWAWNTRGRSNTRRPFSSISR